MIRPASILILAVGCVFAAVPAIAQPTDAPHQTRRAAKPVKAPKPRKTVVQTAAPVAGGINAPSTDFSKIERADEEPRGADGPSLHPAMGAGGMGIGGAF